TRGAQGTTAVSHVAQIPVYSLLNRTLVAPFPPMFFGSPYAGSWTFPIAMPGVRIAAAEVSVTNSMGPSPIARIGLASNTDFGLRTLSGGQYSLQVDGFLAVDESAVPAVVMEAAHAVRDVFAILGTAADASVQLQLNLNGSAYCSLEFGPGMTVSNSV